MAINYGVAFTVNNITYHSKDDYNLIMTNKQISTPVPETHYVEVPGRNGAIDMSDIITGTTKFKPRTITLSFFSPKHVTEWEYCRISSNFKIITAYCASILCLSICTQI